MSEEAILRLSEIGRRLNLTAGAAHVPHLYFMTDSVRTPDPVQIAERLPRGTAVILRHYDTPDRYNLARQLKRVCQERALILIIAGDARLADIVSADGLHMPEWTITRPQLSHRRWLRLKNRISTAAVHSMPGLNRAYRMGVDAVFVSPVFPTASHPTQPATGVLSFARQSRAALVPIIALGGITVVTAPKLIGTSCAGIAAIGGLSE
ncbi:MAG: thiamine phosphate synthase [Rhodospirillaceae bacterium]|nr:thiamine phosphate synthase [Rhodospirillaceae bacterium]